MMGLSKLAAGIAVAATAFALGQARADTIIWIVDTNGYLGQLDITTQHVVAGSVVTEQFPDAQFTDIGFTNNGTLYGTTFDALYKVNAFTGVSTLIAHYSGEAGMNALLGSGSSLLGSSFADNNLYKINPATGGLTAVGTEPYASAGDLAVSNGTLFESGVDFNTGKDALVNASTGAVVGDFTAPGGLTFTGLFALVDAGPTMYAINGTSVYSVNLTNAALTFLFSYAGQSNMGNANGAAYFYEAPEPSSLALMGAAIAGLGLLARRRKA